MRPIELVIEGFRSYHRRTVFDWRERQLIGIVGPIGSGKSSILDAITFALYGKTPVFERENKTLIREGCDSARVELAFRVEGQDWRALRVIRRRGPGQHALYRVEDTGLELDGDREKQVNERITTLLGLDFQAFCRSVFLAQNRFAEFLYASPGERDKVLKGVFGFDRLDQMQRLAKEKRIEFELEERELRGHTRHVEEDRRKLEDQRLRLQTASLQSQSLTQVSDEMRQLDALTDQAEHTVLERTQQLEALERIAVQIPDDEDLLKVSRQMEDAARAQSQADEDRRRAQQRTQEAQEKLNSTLAETGSSENLATTEQALVHLEQSEARRDRLQTALEAAETVQAKRQAEAEQTNAQLHEAQEQASVQNLAVAAAETTKKEANDKLQNHRNLYGDRTRLDQARQQLDRLSIARLELDRAQADQQQAMERRLAAEDALEIVRLGWQAAEGTENEAREQARKQRERTARSEEAFHFARREDMAIHLSQQLELNQPCPVCDQVVKALPAFRLTPAIEEAEEHRAQALHHREESEQVLLEASKTAAGRLQALEHAEDRLEEARHVAEQAEEAHRAQETLVHEATVALRELLSLEVEELDIESLENHLRDFGEQARHFEEQAQLAEATWQRAESDARDARHAFEIATQQALAADQTLDAARQAVDQAALALREAEETVEQVRRTIHVPGSDWQADEAHAQIEAARHLLAKTTLALDQAREAEEQQNQAFETARETNLAVREEQENLIRKLAGLAGQLGLEVEHPASSLTPREWGQRIRQEERAKRRQIQTEKRQIEESKIQAHQRRTDLFEALELSRDISFERALAQAQSSAEQARSRVDELEKRLQLASESEQRLAFVENKIRLFQRLSEDLAPSRFLRYLLDEERRDLAALGSERFEMLSGGRYRFSDDGTFAVLDLANAEAVRKSETLSGGESFLASLALALALAEKVTGRGGRLDAFFLDEGFGSLDPEHFDLAMEGIERLVIDSPGRLITVVSHVPEMRQRVEDLIILDKDPRDGSTLIRQGARSVSAGEKGEA